MASRVPTMTHDTLHRPAFPNLAMTVMVEQPPRLPEESGAFDETLYQVEQAESMLLMPDKSSFPEWSRTVLAAAAAASTAVALWDAHVPQLAWHAYQNTLDHHPIYTKAATSATVYAFGDVLSQRTAAGAAMTQESGKKEFELDYARVFRSLVAGGVGHGPLSHLYYNLSEDFFGHVLHWTAWWSTIPKIIVDQTLFGPFWNNSYLLLIGLMQGHSLRKIGHEMRTTTIPLVVSGLKLWPAVHLVTYGLMPVPYRLVWVDAVEVLWVSILATEAAAAASKTTTKTNEGTCSASATVG